MSEEPRMHPRGYDTTGASATCTTRSPSMPSQSIRARFRRSPAIDFTGYLQISATLTRHWLLDATFSS